MDLCGDVHACRKRPVGGRCEGVDRKLDLLVKELQRYRVAIAGVQESRWFGEDVWPAAEGLLFFTLADLYQAVMMMLLLGMKVRGF